MQVVTSFRIQTGTSANTAIKSIEFARRGRYVWSYLCTKYDALVYCKRGGWVLGWAVWLKGHFSLVILPSFLFPFLPPSLQSLPLLVCLLASSFYSFFFFTCFYFCYFLFFTFINFLILICLFNMCFFSFCLHSTNWKGPGIVWKQSAFFHLWLIWVW